MVHRTRLKPNVWRYVQVAAALGWHGFLPSCWIWRFFRFTKSSRDAKTMTPSGSAPAFSRGQPGQRLRFFLLLVTSCWPAGNCIYRPVSRWLLSFIILDFYRESFQFFQIKFSISSNATTYINCEWFYRFNSFSNIFRF